MPGLPRGRASLSHSLGPPAWTGLRVSVDLGHGPPVPTGFPVTFCLASGVDRLPGMSLYYRCRASRVDGLPFHTHWGLRRGPASPSRLILVMGIPLHRLLPGYVSFGLRRGPASRYVIVLSMPGLPRGRASLPHSLGPPAWTGLRVSVDLGYGPPVPTGFPVTFRLASGVDRLPSMSLYCRCRASRVDGLPLRAGSGLRRGPASWLLM